MYTLELQDCFNIVKAFEKGASFSTDEKSVFALMTPILQTSLVQSEAISSQLSAIDTLSPKGVGLAKNPQDSKALGGDQSSANMDDMSNADSESEGFLDKIVGNFIPDSVNLESSPENIASGLFNSECIPCGQRINMMCEMDLSKFAKFGEDYYNRWLYWLQWNLSQFAKMLDMFSPSAQYVDMCAMIRWLNDFVCIPDLQRILSVLMALISRVSLNLGGAADILLSLVGPLLTPLLSGYVDLLKNYILLVTDPIDCVIDSLQDLLRKLDYNVLFQNINTLDKQVGYGSDTAVSGSVKIPFMDASIDVELPRTGRFEAEFSALGPVGDEIKKENEKNTAEVERARKELGEVKRAMMRVDSSDWAETETLRLQKEEAEDKYREAVRKQTKSAVGRLNADITAERVAFKSSIASMIGFLRKGTQEVEAFFHSVFSEMQKIMGAYLDGGDNMLTSLQEKLMIIQLIAVVTAMITFLASGTDCDKDDMLKPENFLSTSSSYSIWTDDDGSVHIEEDDSETSVAIEALTRAKSATGRKDPYLIKFTGDPTIDIQVARMTEQLVKPNDSVYKCPLNTSVEASSQVARWIEELG